MAMLIIPSSRGGDYQHDNDFVIVFNALSSESLQLFYFHFQSTYFSHADS